MPKRRDWRVALRKAETGMLDQLKKERAKGLSTRYDVAGEMVGVIGATDNKLSVIARTHARNVVEGAIARHEGRQIQQRMKCRQGAAL